jgi:hypothetical protein
MLRKLFAMVASVALVSLFSASQTARGEELAVSGSQTHASGKVLVLAVNENKIGINLSSRWQVRGDGPFNLPWGKGIRLWDPSGVANLAVHLERSGKYTLSKWIDGVAAKFISYYAPGSGSSYDMKEFPIVFAGRSGVLRKYQFSINGQSRRADICVFPLTTGHFVTVIVWNHGTFQDPRTQEAVLSALSIPSG